MNRQRRHGEAPGLDADQAQHGESDDLVERFIDLLSAAIVAGYAHVANENGYQATPRERWGWRDDATPVGARVGWIDYRCELFLLPAAAFKVAQEMASTDGLNVLSQTLWEQMKEHGLLVTTDPGQCTVRRELQHAWRKVLHLKAEALMPRESVQPDQGNR